MLPGSCVLSLPGDYGKIPGLFDVDAILEIVEKEPYGQYREGETFWLLNSVQQKRDEQGNRTVEVQYTDLLDLLNRRSVMYDATTTAGYKVTNADTFCHEVIRENMGSGAAVSRQITGLSVQTDRSPSPFAVIERDITSKRVSDVLKDVADASQRNVTTPLYLSYDFVPAVAGVTFKTYDTCRGVDRRSGAGTFALSEETFAFSSWSIERNYREMSNVIYAVSSGEVSNRTIVEVSSLPATPSQYLRREGVADASKELSVSGISAVGYQQLNSRRARILFEGQVNVGGLLKWNKDLSFGDLVYVVIDGTKYTCRLDAFKRDWSAEGVKTSVRLRAEELL